MKTVYKIVLAATNQWTAHHSARLGAALAYYSIFSMGPLLLIVTSVAGLLFGREAVQGHLSSQFKATFGPHGGQAVEAMLIGASSSSAGRYGAVIGIIMLLIAAVGVVAQLKDALNTIWNVEPAKGIGLWWWIRTYLISFAGILALGFLLSVSLVVSTGLSALYSSDATPLTLLGKAIEFTATSAILVGLFAALFKWFPDTEISWRSVLPGAVATAFLFNMGKLAIAWYVANSALEDTYGAASSVIVLLVWVYYSSLIVLFGAELTHAYASHRSRRGLASIVDQTPHVASV